MQSGTDTGHGGSRSGAVARGLRIAGAVGIGGIALTRCVILFAPRIVFDVDPAVDPLPLGGLGPAGSLALDVVLLLAVACAFAGLALGRRPVSVALVVLALLPVPFVVGHGLGDGGDLWRGATWAAAALAAVAAAHLAREAPLRRVLVALLLAALAPLLVRGVSNMTWEHDATIAQYEAQKDRILAGRGWDPDSPSAAIFERRLRQREPTGWFVTTNVYGSVMVFGAVALFGLARAGRGSARIGCILGAVACAAGVVATGSKGAILAGALGGLLVLAPAVAGRRAGLVALVLVLAALAAVAVRGALLPEGFASERSLLFRWHYLRAAAEIVAGSPLAGVGPDGFQAAFVLHRAPEIPEEVASAHSIFADWIATLGLAGLAWAALALLLVRRTTGPDDAPDTVHAADGTRGAAPLAAAIVAGAGLAVAIIAEAHVLGFRDEMLRLGGLVGGMAVVLFVEPALRGLPGRAIAGATGAAAIALLVHAQIEMTLVQPNAVVFGFVALGLAGAGPLARRARPVGALVPAAAALGLAAWLLVAGALPAARQQALALEAVGLLAPLSARPNRDPAVVAMRRASAAEKLLEAAGAWPRDPWPRVAAAEQLEIAAAFALRVARPPLLERGLEAVAPLVESGDAGRAALAALMLHRALAQATDDPVHADAAIALARRMTAADPNGLAVHRRLADLLWEQGRHDEAAPVYGRVLEIDAAYRLDPLKGLSETAREQVRQRS